MGAPDRLIRLVDRFQRNIEAYRSSGYNETQVRREFVDPLFELLGWDVTNEEGRAESYKDVIHEDAIRIGGRTKAPDYAFRVGGVRKFFVEAKAPRKRLESDAESAFQLRRYGWSAKLPLSVLTDFEELAVYDTRIRPAKTDKATTARILYLRFPNYSREWERIASIFSKDAVLEGSLDTFVASHAKRGTAEVDEAFLGEIEAWRQALARNFALRNPDLDHRALNTAVQRTIDRIVFLRICEDRGVEPYGQLLAALEGDSIYGNLSTIFRRADARYNSGLFHFRAEQGRRQPPDNFSLGLSLDDRVLRAIVKDLYYPDSPYEFSVLPADILGQVYEQFLGKVIRLTKGHRAKVEPKPEVRKAGGVYYTPTRVVEYLVDHSLSRLLIEVKTPKQAAGLRILDPACGSGSFLICAYQRLLDWHLTWYETDGAKNHAKGRRPKVYEGPGGAWHLTTGEKKRILTNSIYGVDVDPQAVEVTKLSLLLKVLEGESADTLESQLKLFHERALPDLGSNIKCGNSLIGTDYYVGKQTSLFDQTANSEVNAFDWESEFADEMKRGGFTVVLGNPPYLSFSGRQAVSVDSSVRDYFERHYPDTGWSTSHGLFIVRAHALARRLVAFIVPDQVGHLEGYRQIRADVAAKSSLVEVRYWGEGVFPGVVTPALTFISDKAYSGPTRIELADNATAECTIPAGDAWLPPSPYSALLRKLESQAASLDEAFADPGVHTGNCSKKLVLPLAQATPDAVPVLEGKQVGRYVCHRPAKVLRLAYSPAAGEYFTIRSLERYTDAGFVIRQTAPRPIVGPRRHADYFRNSLLALYPPKDKRDTRFVVAILNSRLMHFVYRETVAEAGQKAFPQVKVRSLRALPIRSIDFAVKAEKEAHDVLVTLVDEMVQTYARLEDVMTAHERDVLLRRADALDAEIDRAVESLYGLSGEEIATVEAYLAKL